LKGAKEAGKSFQLAIAFSPSFHLKSLTLLQLQLFICIVASSLK
jgi:hypothetical protein